MEKLSYSNIPATSVEVNDGVERYEVAYQDRMLYFGGELLSQLSRSESVLFYVCVQEPDSLQQWGAIAQQTGLQSRTLAIDLSNSAGLGSRFGRRLTGKSLISAVYASEPTYTNTGKLSVRGQSGIRFNSVLDERATPTFVVPNVPKPTEKIPQRISPRDKKTPLSQFVSPPRPQVHEGVTESYESVILKHLLRQPAGMSSDELRDIIRRMPKPDGEHFNDEEIDKKLRMILSNIYTSKSPYTVRSMKIDSEFRVIAIRRESPLPLRNEVSMGSQLDNSNQR